jgi:hypothetical protein
MSFLDDECKAEIVCLECRECGVIAESHKMKNAMFSHATVCSSRCEIENTIRDKSNPDRYIMRASEIVDIQNRWEEDDY